MKRVLNWLLLAALAAVGLQAVPAEAVVVPKETPLTEKAFRQPGLYVPEVNQPLSELASLAPGLERELAELGVPRHSGFFDTRTGRWSSLILSRPLIPGTGVGNNLRWPQSVADGTIDDTVLRDRTWSALRAFLQQHQAELRVDLAQLEATPSIGVFEDGNLIQVHASRQVAGVPVRDSGLTAIINHGNLVLFGLQNWADVDAPAAASLAAEGARSVVAQHIAPNVVGGFRAERLELIPTLQEGSYAFRLAWVVPVSVAGDIGTWEGLVDAASGELLAFEDRNQYARRVMGGVYPVSNDQRPPDGIEQAGWPMPFANITVNGSPMTTTTGGNFGCATGTVSTALVGQFARINDTCGAINETSPSGDLDLGFGPTPAATDCTVPGGHSAGDTKSARSAFYELTRINEQARGYLPGNAWLQTSLLANVNILQTCNANWNGFSVQFFRDSGSACRNTGEIAAIFDHEWGHGMDNNGVNGNISSPGESIADIHAILRLGTPCVGRGFFKNQVCTGYGDGCDGTPATGCTGVRDSDFINHRCNQPHGVNWILNGFTSPQCGGTGTAAACPAVGQRGPCNRETHCEGQAVAEIAWDLQLRDLRAAPFNFDSNTALELTTRLFYLGSQSVTSWYTCAVGGGCGATGGYLLVLAADDDNGSITDGTPHMSAIRAAFERHEMHCVTQTVANTGCAGGPTTAPTVTATATTEGVNLSWTAVAGASRYFVYRTEGVSACDFGKVKVGDVTGTTFSDTGLQGGRAYSYIVLPVGANTACFGRASTCANATATVAAQCIVQSVAPISLAVDAAGNGVLQPNETAIVVAPTWRNTGNAAMAATGALSAFTGPVGPTYTINDAVADYGTIPAGTNQACTNCYAVTITSSSRPVQHWDPTALETITPTATTKNWVLHVGDSFTDVVGTSGFYRFVETIFHKGVTGGCGPNIYCPTASTTREQMAAFVLVSKEGAGYQPPACSPPNLFSDVPATSPFCRFIEELANRTVVTGCGPNLYCPTTAVSRETMAVFALRTLDPALNPPACGTPVFADVPASSPFCRWIEELVRRGVVSGCGGGNYCPTDPVTREQMGVFLSLTFGLTLYGL